MDAGQDIQTSPPNPYWDELIKQSKYGGQSWFQRSGFNDLADVFREAVSVFDSCLKTEIRTGLNSGNKSFDVHLHRLNHLRADAYERFHRCLDLMESDLPSAQLDALNKFNTREWFAAWDTFQKHSESMAFQDMDQVSISLIEEARAKNAAVEYVEGVTNNFKKAEELKQRIQHVDELGKKLLADSEAFRAQAAELDKEIQAFTEPYLADFEQMRRDRQVIDSVEDDEGGFQVHDEPMDVGDDPMDNFDAGLFTPARGAQDSREQPPASNNQWLINSERSFTQGAIQRGRQQPESPTRGSARRQVTSSRAQAGGPTRGDTDRWEDELVGGTQELRIQTGMPPPPARTGPPRRPPPQYPSARQDQPGRTGEDPPRTPLESLFIPPDETPQSRPRQRRKTTAGTAIRTDFPDHLREENYIGSKKPQLGWVEHIPDLFDFEGDAAAKLPEFQQRMKRFMDSKGRSEKTIQANPYSVMNNLADKGRCLTGYMLRQQETAGPVGTPENPSITRSCAACDNRRMCLRIVRIDQAEWEDPDSPYFQTEIHWLVFPRPDEPMPVAKEATKGADEDETNAAEEEQTGTLSKRALRQKRKQDQRK